MRSRFVPFISLLPLVIWFLLLPIRYVSAQQVDYLYNGSFSSNAGGWAGAGGGAGCDNGQPSLGEAFLDALVFSYELGTVTQAIVIPVPGVVTLTFDGQLGEAGGWYEGTLSDQDEMVSTSAISESALTGYSLSVTTLTSNEVVAVSFTAQDSLFWAGCFGPIITNASLFSDSLPPDTSSPPLITDPPSQQYALSVVGYSINQIPPVIDSSTYPTCGETSYPDINQNWDSGEYYFGTCGGDLFMLRYAGFITIPDNQSIEFMVLSDDGSEVRIDGITPFGWWTDKGCSGSTSGVLSITPGTYAIEAWMYENGGGTCFQLMWNIDGAGWDTVPASAYSSIPPPPVESTTTTTTSTTQAPVEESSSTSTSPSGGTNPPTSASPSSAPITQPSTPPSSSAETTPVTMPPSQSQPPTIDPPLADPVVQPVEPSISVPSSEPLAVPEPQPISELSASEQVSKIDLTSASNQALVSVISASGFSSLNKDQVRSVLSNIEFGQLTDEETAELVSALNQATDDVKQVFEEEVNVYSGQFDSYVPSGSKIPVGQRRVIVAVTAATTLMAPTPGSSKKNRTK